MATFTITVNITKTLATLNETNIKAVLDWLQTNIKNTLPSDCTLTINFNIVP